MQLTRREFLMTAAGGVAGAMVARASSIPDVIYAGTPETQSNPLEQVLMTFCRQCPGGCGLRVRVVNGCVVGIAGNPVHPINRGGVCARAPAAVQTLYNPDRLIKPMLLAGPKGSGHYRPIEWAEAARRLAEKLAATRENPGPHSLAMLTNGNRGLSRLLWSRFFQAYGSNNLIDWSFPEAHQAYPAVWAMQGIKYAVGYDLARARYVLSFGSQWLDAHWSPAQASAAYAALRAAGQAHRVRCVHIEPRLSLTGAKADEWVPVRAGTEGAFALGLAHVLLREGLYDRRFVKNFAHGFEDPDNTGRRIGFRRLVLRDYTPAHVAKITGVDEGDIFRIAREFAAHKPALAIGFDGSGVSTQRCADRMAIHALNALVGSIDVPGGVTHFQDVALLSGPVGEPDARAQAGLAKPRVDQTDLTVYPLSDYAPHRVTKHLLADVPYPVKVLMLDGANPVFDSPNGDHVKQALAKVPFVVSFAPWKDDSAVWADMIIPDRHFLTRWDVDVAHTLAGEPTVTVGRPVVAAESETPGTAALVLELARQIGGPVAAALPFDNPKHAVRRICDDLYESGRGGPFGPIAEQGWVRLLERSGWRPPRAASAATFYQQTLAGGGWTDPIYYHREWDRIFRAPRRRFAFHSAVIAERIKPTTEADDIRCLPHHDPVHAAPADQAFPLCLYVYPFSVLANLPNTNVPWLIDASGAYMAERWQTWVEINPATAKTLHVKDGDTVIVASAHGQLRTRARLFEGIVPDVVAIPFGLGHDTGGRWAQNVGKNPNVLIGDHSDPLTAQPLWNTTRVSVKKA